MKSEVHISRDVSVVLTSKESFKRNVNIYKVNEIFFLPIYQKGKYAITGTSKQAKKEKRNAFFSVCSVNWNGSLRNLCENKLHNVV